MEELKNLIKDGESDTLEFKENFTKEVAITAGAFANTKGGTILIGVTDGRKIRGVSLSNEALKDWVNQISQVTEPMVIPEIDVEEIDGKRVIGLNERQVKAVTYVKEKGRITNGEYQELTGVSRQTATIDLNELVASNVLERIGKVGKGVAYQMTKLTNK